MSLGRVSGGAESASAGAGWEAGVVGVRGCGLRLQGRANRMDRARTQAETWAVTERVDHSALLLGQA